jgi:hypothetical protein
LLISFSTHTFAAKKIYYTIDRFEGNYAVLESDERKIYNVPKSKLPRKAKEGDVFYKKGNSYIFDKKETNKRWSDINSLFHDIVK